MKTLRETSLYPLLSDSRYGYQKLLGLARISVSGVNLSVATLLGFAGLVLALRGGRLGTSGSLLWSSDKKDSKDKILFVPGLRNLGNNCFLNVILQALASCYSFRLFLEENVQEAKASSGEGQPEGLPLAVALGALFKVLCSRQERRVVLNPQKVMAAMNLYIPQFHLTNQQDAAEAFLHLLSSIREEFSELCIQNHGSLADVAAPNYRIISIKTGDDVSMPKKWRQRFLGPFDGILSSVLTCQSCFSEIVMDFEFFHTLPLSPVVGASAAIADGCTLGDCLYRFTAPERVENYHCSHCWHLAAAKYLASAEENEENMKKLRCCSEEDSCGCNTLASLQGFPWSDRFSHTVKQLNIAFAPKILCLQIQRADINTFGDLIKLQGHVSFPLILNMSPFVSCGVGTKGGRENKRMPDMNYYINMNTYIQRKLKLITNTAGAGLLRKAFDDQILEVDSGSDVMQSHDEVAGHHSYHLVSVVEHYGSSGSGHYTVYRAEPYSQLEDDAGRRRQVNGVPLQWFCISDSEVQRVSEKEVLSASATLLFYERIIDF